MRIRFGQLKGDDVVIRSVAQIELDAKSMGNFFGAPLISDQVAWRGDNIGLPSVGVVLANNDLQTGRSDFCGDHLSETSCGDVFLDHDDVPQMEMTVNDQVKEI